MSVTVRDRAVDSAAVRVLTCDQVAAWLPATAQSLTVPILTRPALARNQVDPALRVVMVRRREVGFSRWTIAPMPTLTAT
jgi:hypothetical protein